jgi:hypothetical protein
VQGTDWYAIFCEVVGKTIAAALSFNKENCFSVACCDLCGD